MAQTYISPDGNPEMWEGQPEGYYTIEEWQALNTPTPPTLEEARAAKLAEIIAGANAMSVVIKAKYSQPEIDSWQQQEAEARALLADDSATAPLVRDLAANAGVTPLEFAQRIVNNADAAAAATKAIILQQQAMEKAVNTAQNVEDVLGITVNYSLGT